MSRRVMSRLLALAALSLALGAAPVLAQDAATTAAPADVHAAEATHGAADGAEATEHAAAAIATDAAAGEVDDATAHADADHAAVGDHADAGEHAVAGEHGAAAGEHGAAAEGEHGGEAATFLGLPRWIWLTLNLFAFWGLLLYFLVPPIRSFLDARREGIQRSFEEARRQTHESENMRGTLADKIAVLEAEVTELATRARTEGERERQEILAQAARERDRLANQTREEIAHRLTQARQELTSYTARLAADLARERVAREITPEDRRRLFEESVRRLEKQP